MSRFWGNSLLTGLSFPSSPTLLQGESSSVLMADHSTDRRTAKASASTQGCAGFFNALRERRVARERQAMMESDQRMAESAARAVREDGLFLQREMQIARDHELALQLAESDQITENQPGTGYDRDWWLDDEVLARMDAEYMPHHDDDDDRIPGASPQDEHTPIYTCHSGQKRRREDEERKQCTACGDEKPASDIATAPCDHKYCDECLSRLFRDAMNDGTLFPPRCCRQEMPLGKMRFFLGAQLARDFEIKAIEMSTIGRTYCSDPRCSTFIPPHGMAFGSMALCPTCFEATCVRCKQASHNGNCREDEAMERLRETAEAEGWRRCQCGRYIELHYGCNHMTLVLAPSICR